MPKALLDNDTMQLIHKLGREYKPALLPADVTRGRVGWCFDDCAIRALQSKGKYRYVEGLAVTVRSPEPRLHAWLTDGENAFDPTWMAMKDDTGEEFPIPGAYLGIEMPIELVAKFMVDTGYQGVLANRHRLPALVEEILGVPV